MNIGRHHWCKITLKVLATENRCAPSPLAYEVFQVRENSFANISNCRRWSVLEKILGYYPSKRRMWSLSQIRWCNSQPCMVGLHVWLTNSVSMVEYYHPFKVPKALPITSYFPLSLFCHISCSKVVLPRCSFLVFSNHKSSLLLTSPLPILSPLQQLLVFFSSPHLGWEFQFK